MSLRARAGERFSLCYYFRTRQTDRGALVVRQTDRGLRESGRRTGGCGSPADGPGGCGSPAPLREDAWCFGPSGDVSGPDPLEADSPAGSALRVLAPGVLVPGVLAQEAGPGSNSSGHEDGSRPELPDTTPAVPGDTRARRKQMRNPFYPVSADTYGACAVVAFASLIFSVGIIGNVAIMCIVCHNYYMRSISNSLLANLALWDFVVIFFCLPLVVFHELTWNWLLGEFSCKIIPYLEVASLGVTTFTLCALCIDRFRAAASVRLSYQLMENWASTGAKLLVIWAGALLLALPELLIRQLVTEEGDPSGVPPCQRCVLGVSPRLPDALYVLGLTYRAARLWWVFGCYFCLPTLFTLCCSLLTARKIQRLSGPPAGPQAGPPGGPPRGGSRRQVRLEGQMNCAVVALAILYGSCVIPDNVVNMLGSYLPVSVARRTQDRLQLTAQMLLFCRAAATPALFFWLCPPLTRALLRCCCCCCLDQPPHSPPRPPPHSSTNLDACSTELEPLPLGAAGGGPSTFASHSGLGTHC
ncbi:unnamed protein product [Menidia menidia]|uniref:(Atlantic silverside) hypothetical protein n=1 Tax=Menidia menidia TaxID=238744 RepID=A0A8S4BDQ4_9TELE|nr:unnamed protein product [Menidia menidia]